MACHVVFLKVSFFNNIYRHTPKQWMNKEHLDTCFLTGLSPGPTLYYTDLASHGIVYRGLLYRATTYRYNLYKC